MPHFSDRTKNWVTGGAVAMTAVYFGVRLAPDFNKGPEPKVCTARQIGEVVLGYDAKRDVLAGRLPADVTKLVLHTAGVDFIQVDVSNTVEPKELKVDELVANAVIAQIPRGQEITTRPMLGDVPLESDALSIRLFDLKDSQCVSPTIPPPLAPVFA